MTHYKIFQKKIFLRDDPLSARTPIVVCIRLIGRGFQTLVIALGVPNHSFGVVGNPRLHEPVEVPVILLFKSDLDFLQAPALAGLGSNEPAHILEDAPGLWSRSLGDCYLHGDTLVTRQPKWLR